MGKGGGSQLSQLKAKLHSSGVSDRRQASKKSRQRHGGQDEKDAAANRRKKISSIVGALNPFDEKVTKPKHDVLGRKIKGAVGRPGAAKASGLAQRCATLLPEWEARNRAGAFVDRRFGENDANMTPEDKMLERYATEKQRRAAKGAAFNLNDDDELLTHYGQSLGGMDDLADIRLGDDDDEEDAGRLTGQGHFGGFDDDEQGTDGADKSKADVMRELIAKSKYHKLERQKVKDADDDLREQLDDDLAEIRGLLYQQPATTNGEADDAKPRPPLPTSSGANGTSTSVVEGKKPSSSYDVFVREMAFERRAKPQDRLKSEAELAADQAQRLLKAEKARLKRMRGDSDNESDQDEDEQGGGRKKRKKATAAASAKRSGQADDLDDDFELDGMTAGEVYGLGPGLAEDGSDEESEDEEDEDDEEEDSEEDADEAAQASAAVDEEEDDGEDDFADLADIEHAVQIGEDEESEKEGEHEALTNGATLANKTKKSGAKTSASLPSVPATSKASTSKVPYTFPCPATHDELLSTLEAHSIEPRYIPIVIKRIRTLHHASLAEDNKYKLQAFIGVLIDHALHWAGQAQAASNDAAQQNKLAFAIINALVPHIYSLSQAYPMASAQHFVNKLALMQRNLSRGLAKGAMDPDARTWPALAEITLLRLVGAIWPTSDRQHPVTTPLTLLVAQYLGHARIRSLSDIASGLFLTSLVVSNEKDSKRLVPEALNFLFSAIAILAPLKGQEKGMVVIRRIAEEYGIPTPDVDAPHTSGLRLTKVDAVTDIDKAVDLPALMAADGNSEETIATLLNLSTTLLTEFVQLYQGSTSFVELFAPFATLLAQTAPASCIPAAMVSDLARQVKLAASSRRFLRLQAHRAIPISTQIPKFDQQGFNPDRKGALDPDADRVQIAKMKALIKKERKGAIRELRKDNQFLADVKQQAREEEDRSYKKKMDKIMSTLQDERSEQKQMEKAKANIKRRAGKK